MARSPRLTTIKTTLARAGFSTFLLAIVAAIALAWLRPTWGNQPVLNEVTFYGVAAIFFLYGLSISASQLRADLSNWKVHALVQSATFVIFPIIALVVKPLFPQAGATVWLGVFYLAVLPSTVSSSVVMVSLAKGNITSAIFNATLSGFIGILLTPLLMSFFLAASGNFDWQSVTLKLAVQVLLPVGVGMVLHQKWGAFVTKHKARLKWFDQSIIVLIIYTSFCRSFVEGIFEGFGWQLIGLLAIAMAMLFLMMVMLLQWISKVMSLSRYDMITVVFCGSKKSLVHGTVMSKVLFHSCMSVGILLLPLMLYHALQLMMASALAQKFATDNRG